MTDKTKFSYSEYRALDINTVAVARKFYLHYFLLT